MIKKKFKSVAAAAHELANIVRSTPDRPPEYAENWDMFADWCYESSDRELSQTDTGRANKVKYVQKIALESGPDPYAHFSADVLSEYNIEETDFAVENFDLSTEEIIDTTDSISDEDLDDIDILEEAKGGATSQKAMSESAQLLAETTYTPPLAGITLKNLPEAPPGETRTQRIQRIRAAMAPDWDVSDADLMDMYENGVYPTETPKDTSEDFELIDPRFESLYQSCMARGADETCTFYNGPSGVGKTSAIHDIVERQLGGLVIDFNLTTDPPEELIGQMVGAASAPKSDGDVEDIELRVGRGLPDRIRRMWEFAEGNPLAPLVVFLDEVNIEDSGYKLIMGFCQPIGADGKRYIGNLEIPPHTVFVAAGNPRSVNPDVIDMPLSTWQRLRFVNIELDIPLWQKSFIRNPDRMYRKGAESWTCSAEVQRAALRDTAGIFAAYIDASIGKETGIRPIDEVVGNFNSNQLQEIASEGESGDALIIPGPRTWIAGLSSLTKVMVDKMYRTAATSGPKPGVPLISRSKVREVLEQHIGKKQAAAFSDYWQGVRDLPPVVKVLDDPKNIKIGAGNHVIPSHGVVLMDRCARFVEKKPTTDNVRKAMNAVLELYNRVGKRTLFAGQNAVDLIGEIARKKKIKVNTPEMVDIAKKLGKEFNLSHSHLDKAVQRRKQRKGSK